MSYYVGNGSYGSTGSKTLSSIGFTPVGCRITIGAKGSSEASVMHLSAGFADGVGQYVESTYADSSTWSSKFSSSKCVSHWAKVSGTLTEVISATFTSFSASNGGSATFNFTAVDVNYDIIFEFWS